MAFSLEANVYLATYAIWTDPADDERHRGWVHGHHARLAEQVGEGALHRRLRLLAPARPLHGRRTTSTACSEIRAARDPDGRFVPYLGL